MPHLLDECNEFFHSKDLYEILEIKKTATEKQIKKAYHKISLRVHPDRVTASDKSRSTQKFQIIGKIYSILSDESKRGLYDECGEIDDDDECISDDKDWNAYWRLLFKPITKKDIVEFEKNHKGSKAEISDVRQCYLDCKGDVEMMLERILCASDDCLPRYYDIIDTAISADELPSFKTYKKLSAARLKKRKKQAAEEALEAEEFKKEQGIGDGSLESMILQRREGRAKEMDSFLDNLASKYAEPTKEKTKRKPRKK